MEPYLGKMAMLEPLDQQQIELRPVEAGQQRLQGGLLPGVSQIRAWRREEAAITWRAPAWRRRWLSLPGLSMSKW